MRIKFNFITIVAACLFVFPSASAQKTEPSAREIKAKS